MREYTSKTVETAFKLDGVTFDPPGMSLLDIAKMGKRFAALAEVETDSPEGLEAIDDFFVAVMGDDLDRFRAHVREHKTDPDTLMEIIVDVLTAAAGGRHPLRQRSGSADGPTSTPPMLKVVSSSGQVSVEELTPERAAELRAAVARADEQERLTG